MALQPYLRPAVAYCALLLALFAASGISTYVYKYVPTRDTVSVQLEDAPPPDGPRVISGTVVNFEGGQLTLTTDDGTQTFTAPTGTPIEDLLQAPGGLADGTPVNVGLLSTRYGLVLTGIVAIEEPRP